MSCGQIVVGAYDEDVSKTDQGAAYVYLTTDSGSSWSQTDKLLASDPTISAYFGRSVAVNGNIVSPPSLSC